MTSKPTPSNSAPSCDFCGLPLPRPLPRPRLQSRSHRDGGPSEGEGPRYCCFGCRFAASVAQERGESAETGAARWTLTRLGLSIFFAMNVMAFTMALWTRDVYGAGAADATSALSPSVLDGLFRYLCLLFSIPVLMMLAPPLWSGGWEELKRGQPSSDLLLGVGVFAAFAYSAVSVFRDEGPVYFEVVCVVLVMATLGRWLEATGKLRASQAIGALEQALPKQARLISDGEERLVDLDDIQPGDQVRSLPGERIPIDGRILRNSASVDQQALTGESWPVAKSPGDSVLGGSLNLDGDLVIEATATADDGVLGRMIELVRRARESKGRYQRLADRASSIFAPAVALIAIAAFTAQTWMSGWDAGLMTGLAVVLIACPCALGVATPMAMWTALGRAARDRIFFRDGETMEKLASVRAIRFDKTGTLTDGSARTAEFTTDGADRLDVLRVASALASSSNHAASSAILRYRIAENADEALAVEPRQHPGRGIVGEVDGVSAILGSPRFLEESRCVLPDRLRSACEAATEQGRSVALAGWGGRVRGVFAFQESLRPSTRGAIERLKRDGFDLEILTGDNAACARKLSEELGVPARADLLPSDKAERIQEAKRRFGSVAMVGDGINDAVALETADVGVTIGQGTDAARDSAQVCLFDNDLNRLPQALRLSRRAVSAVKLNLIWAFGYNAIGVVAAAFGKLNPVLAAILMTASSALVIANSLRLGSMDLDDGLGPREPETEPRS